MGGLKESFMGSSILIKICLVLLLLAQICSWIAFTVPEWAKTYNFGTSSVGYTGLGLWRRCAYSGRYSAPAVCSILDGTRQDWFAAVQAFAIFGFIGINVGFFILVLQVFTGLCKGVGDLGFWNAIQCIVTAICYLIAVIIFAVRFDSGYYGRSGRNKLDIGELGFSFALAIIALLLEAVAGVLMIVDGKKGTGTSPA